MPTFPWLALVTPLALFFLMSLFMTINIQRYGSFSSLFMAGKVISLISTSLWLFFENNTIIWDLHIGSMTPYIALSIAVFLLLGDLLSVWLVIRMQKYDNQD